MKLLIECVTEIETILTYILMLIQNVLFIEIELCLIPSKLFNKKNN